MLALFPVSICCACAALAALGVVLLRRPVHVALSLLAHSLSVAALYMTMSADFAAVAQTLIYSGAIVVLFLIVVALLPEGGKEQSLDGGRFASSMIAFGAILAALAALFIAQSAIPSVHTNIPSVADVGRPLFHELLGAFELTAPLLLAAIVGAISLWRRQEGPTS